MRTKKRRTNKTKNRYFTRRRRGTKKIIRRKKRTKARTAVRTKKARKQRNYHRHRGNYRRGNYHRGNYRGGDSIDPDVKAWAQGTPEEFAEGADGDRSANPGAEGAEDEGEGAIQHEYAEDAKTKDGDGDGEGTGTNVEVAELDAEDGEGAEGTGAKTEDGDAKDPYAYIDSDIQARAQGTTTQEEDANTEDGDAKTENENPIVITDQKPGSNTKSEQPVTGVTGAVTGVPLADKEQPADQDEYAEGANLGADVPFAQLLEKEEVKKAQSVPKVFPTDSDVQEGLPGIEGPVAEGPVAEGSVTGVPIADKETPAHQEPPAEVKEIIDIKAQPLEKAQSSPAQGNNGFFDKVNNLFSNQNNLQEEETEDDRLSQKAIPVTNPSGENTDENPPTDITGKKDGDQNTTDQIEQPSSKKSRRKKRNRGRKTKKKQTNNPAAAAKQKQPQAPKQEQPQAPKQEQPQAAKSEGTQQQQAANLKDKPKGPKSNKKTFNKKTRKNRGPRKGTKRKEDWDYDKKIEKIIKDQEEYYKSKNYSEEDARARAKRDAFRHIEFKKEMVTMKKLHPDKEFKELKPLVVEKMKANDLWYKNIYKEIEEKLSSEDSTFKELSDKEKANRIKRSNEMVLAKKERKEPQDKVNEQDQRTESKKGNNRGNKTGNKTGNNNTRRSGPRPQGRPQGKQTRKIPKNVWKNLSDEEREEIKKNRWTHENREEYEKELAKLMKEKNVKVATRKMKKKASEIANEKFPPQKITRKAKTGPRQDTKKSPKENFPPLANAEQPQQQQKEPATMPSFAAALAKKKSSPPKKSQSPEKKMEILYKKGVTEMKRLFTGSKGGTRKKTKKTKKT